MMRFEVIFRGEGDGMQVSRVVQARSFEEAAVLAARELHHLGLASDLDGLPYPVTIRRIL